MNKPGELLVVLLILVLIIGIIANMCDSRQAVNLKQQAVDHGYAEYDNTTGEWGWIEKE